MIHYVALVLVPHLSTKVTCPNKFIHSPFFPTHNGTHARDTKEESVGINPLRGLSQPLEGLSQLLGGQSQPLRGQSQPLGSWSQTQEDLN